MILKKLKVGNYDCLKKLKDNFTIIFYIRNTLFRQFFGNQK